MAWRRWFLGDAMAQLTITPAILWLFVGWRNVKMLGRSRLIEAGITLLGLMLLAYFSVQENNPVSPAGSFFFLPFFLTTWFAVRFGMLGASAAVAVVSFFVTASAIYGYGPFANQSPEHTAFSLQVFLVPRALTVYFIALSVEQLERARAFLSESEQRFRALANDAPVLIWRSGPDKLCNFVNQGWLEFTGRTLEQEMGSGWVENLHPDDREHCLHIYETAFDARQPSSWEFRVRGRDGDYHWILSRGVPHFGADGEFEGYIGSALDISDHKKVQELSNVLTHMQRVAAIGELSAAITHEVRQPLAAILLNMRAAEKLLEVPNPPNIDIRAIVTDIKASVARANDVIDRTKNFFRKQKTEKQPMDINTAISQVVQLTASEAKQRLITVRSDLAGDLPPVLADHVQMQQVLINLIVNGMDAMGKIPISARLLTVRSRRHDAHSVEITVSDRGPGLSPEIREHVFDTFFSTKETGTGIGLSIARSIVTAHEGRIWVENNQGGGAAFHVTLPLAVNAAATVAA
jgi:PAS domain S-box-containing protein